MESNEATRNLEDDSKGRDGRRVGWYGLSAQSLQENGGEGRLRIERNNEVMSSRDGMKGGDERWSNGQKGKGGTFPTDWEKRTEEHNRWGSKKHMRFTMMDGMTERGNGCGSKEIEGRSIRESKHYRMKLENRRGPTECAGRRNENRIERASCYLHGSALEDKEVNIVKIEDMLCSDIIGSIVVDVPGDEIVPILCFFERHEGLSGLRLSGFSSTAAKEGKDVRSPPPGRKEEVEAREGLIDKEEGIDGGSRRKRRIEDERRNNKEKKIFTKSKAEDCDKEPSPVELNDCRYRYFLKRVFPTMQKDDERALKYIVSQRDMLLNRTKSNRAEIPEICSGPVKAPMNIISCIPEVPETGFTKEEDKLASELIYKYGNNFKKIRELAPHLRTEKCVLKYYLMKDKTYSYMKHKSGRISDSEVKLIIESTWSEYERNVFIQHFRIFGKSWAKYQPLINKSERDLKMFFRYYTKFILPSSESTSTTVSMAPRRVSISKEDVLKKWTIDERQVFAIYFPYYNKNWVLMAAYFPAKTSGDLRQYYNRYYKSLSYNEQRLEASLYDFGQRVTTPPVRHIGNAREEVVFCGTAGVLFKK
ncbi:hypothetical protein EROM_010890 [Encephalitozoon romaleae SJ-2008]|uniref:Myb-like domain-containing protein n=1 Tax=Encephalitozoon romaleae (strain SJ-2008) TaxID=1178016 RepID=I6ZGW9_ENCRO|nr:hypothetical protein EROM_010890 [Encephalitozoon romaleae SJ-2008]AFN82433.1 hypothetical protein EROM_010890 [Encephalitozoon romaleae SJ-2008]